MNPNPLEKVIETKVCQYAKGLGCLVYKFTSPQRRSVPDRLFITPDGVVFFIEFKRLNSKPTAAQAEEIKKMRSKGVQVFVVHTVLSGKNRIDSMLQGPSNQNAFNDPAFN